MNIYCLSEGELYNIENGKEHLVHCERVESYRDAVRKMKARDEWKTTGKGAKFMGVEQKEYGENEAFDMLRGIGSCGDKGIYTTFADNVGGMYFKDSEGENYIFANREEIINDIDAIFFIICCCYFYLLLFVYTHFTASAKMIWFDSDPLSLKVILASPAEK